LPSRTTTTVNFGTLTSIDVSVANNKLTLDDPNDPFDPGYHDGDPFTYLGPVDTSAGDVGIPELTPGTIYHVKTTATPRVIQLLDDSGTVVTISLPAGTTTTNINYTFPYHPRDTRAHAIVAFGPITTPTLSGTAPPLL